MKPIGSVIMAAEMIPGHWYKQEKDGRFTCGGHSANGVLCHDDGDLDMQSSFFLPNDAKVIVAKSK